MPVAIPLIAVAVGAVASAAVGGGIIGALVGAGTAFAITSVGGSVFPSRPPSSPAIPSRAVDNTTAPGAGRTQSVRQPLTEHQIVFGRCKVGGPIVFIHSATDDQGRADGYFYAVVVLAAHRVQSIGDVWLGDALATDAKYSGLVRIDRHLGAADQVANANLIAETAGKWTANHRGRGRAYVAVRLKITAQAFPSGPPNIAALVSGGRFFVHAGGPALPVTTLNANALRGDVTIQGSRPRRDLFNGVRAVYVDPAKNWQPTDAPPLLAANYVAEDGGEAIYRSMEFPLTTSVATVQRIMKAELERNRRQREVAFPANLSALRLRPWDSVTLALDRLGPFPARVTGWRLAPDGGVDLTLAEEDPAIWDWDPAVDERATGDSPSVVLPNPGVIAASPAASPHWRRLALRAVSGFPGSCHPRSRGCRCLKRAAPILPRP